MANKVGQCFHFHGAASSRVQTNIFMIPFTSRMEMRYVTCIFEYVGKKRLKLITQSSFFLPQYKIAELAFRMLNLLKQL